MEKLKCDICGGQIEMQADGKRGVCLNCGTAYSLDRMREMFSGVKVSVTGTNEDVEQWKALVNTYLKALDFTAAENVINKILEAAPTDTFANGLYPRVHDWFSMDIQNGVLVKYKGQAPEVEIPHGVKEIGGKAFMEDKTLVKVKIPDSVTRIGFDAFYDCTSLTSVEIPNSVTLIGSQAFGICTSLTSVVIPNSVTEIGESAFQWCTSLKSVVIPNTVASIGNTAFSGCKSLTSVEIPNSVTSIGYQAFSGCKSLAELHLPQNVELCGNCFDQCTSLFRTETPIACKDVVCVFSNGPIGWRSERLCQHCGGEFKGVFSKVCSKCGKPKDY